MDHAEGSAHLFYCKISRLEHRVNNKQATLSPSDFSTLEEIRHHHLHPCLPCAHTKAHLCTKRTALSGGAAQSTWRCTGDAYPMAVGDSVSLREARVSGTIGWTLLSLLSGHSLTGGHFPHPSNMGMKSTLSALHRYAPCIHIHMHTDTSSMVYKMPPRPFSNL